jgi:hypothetical protein
VCLCLVSLDPVQGAVCKPLSSLTQVISWMPFTGYILSRSPAAVCIKTASAEQKPELAFHFFGHGECDSTLYSYTKLMWFSVDCSCIWNGSTLLSTPASLSHPRRYMDYSPHHRLCISATLVLFRPSYGKGGSTVRLMNNCSYMSYRSPSLYKQIIPPTCFVTPSDNKCEEGLLSAEFHI